MKKLKKYLKKTKSWLTMSWYLSFHGKAALKGYWILIDSKNGKDLGSNMLRIAEELAQDPAYKKYRIFISCNADKKDDIAKMKIQYGLDRVRLIRENGFRYARIAALAKYLFTDTSFPLWFAKKDGQVITNTWHGTPLKMMGKDVKNRAYDMGNVQKNHLIADYLIYPSDYMKDHMVSAYFLDDLYQGKILCSGYPRNSVFFDAKKGAELCGKLGLEGKRLYSYMPTWRGVLKHIDRQKNTYQVEYFLADLDKKLADDEIFFVRLHPFIGNTIQFSAYEHIRPFPEGYEPYDILNMCDCMVTDYSSVMFDYANSRKKIILFVYDRELYMDERGVYASIDTFPFPQVRRVDDLLAQMRAPKQYDDSSFLEKFCQYDQKDAAQGLCRHIIKGEKVFEEFQTERNGKENVLIYGGGLGKNGLTTALLNLLANIDLEKRNYFITFRSQSMQKFPERVELLPEQVRFFPIATIQIESLGEVMAEFLYFKMDKTASFIVKKVDKHFRRLYQSIFGCCDLSSVIHYSGYEKGVINLFQQATVKRMIFVHNDMVGELKSKGNQHGPSLKRAYHDYDKVVPVTKDIYGPTLELGRRKENIQIVNNCHDHRSVLEKAERELAFEAETFCTVSLERLREILESGARKIINIGRFSPEKGHRLLLEAFERYHKKNPDSYLIIIGGYGALFKQTLAQAEALSCSDHVVIIRSVANPMPILKRCDLLVLSSLYEGLGLVILEADTIGIPVISTDIPGPRCFMERYGGFMVPPDVKGIYNGLKAFDKGEVGVMAVDYEKYNRDSVQQFEELFAGAGE
ncbi:MAG: glycosyltransferase [Lachnospiraceae bacterium]|nr:glycosyltransferase [Lachnospiraceae bacterium]